MLVCKFEKSSVVSVQLEFSFRRRIIKYELHISTQCYIARVASTRKIRFGAREREGRKLTRGGVEGRAAGVRIGDGVASVGTVTVRRAGRAAAITTAGYDATWTSATALSVGVDATTDAAAAVAAASAATAAATATPAGTGPCRHGITV